MDEQAEASGRMKQAMTATGTVLSIRTDDGTYQPIGDVPASIMAAMPKDEPKSDGAPWYTKPIEVAHGHYAPDTTYGLDVPATQDDKWVAEFNRVWAQCRLNEILWGNFRMMLVFDAQPGGLTPFQAKVKEAMFDLSALWPITKHVSFTTCSE